MFLFTSLDSIEEADSFFQKYPHEVSATEIDFGPAKEGKPVVVEIELIPHPVWLCPFRVVGVEEEMTSSVPCLV